MKPDGVAGFSIPSPLPSETRFAIALSPGELFLMLREPAAPREGEGPNVLAPEPCLGVVGEEQRETVCQHPPHETASRPIPTMLVATEVLPIERGRTVVWHDRERAEDDALHLLEQRARIRDVLDDVP